MPFIDLNQKSSDSYLIPEADITIIGAGAAGILLSIKLSRQGKKVLLLESGHFTEDESKQALNKVEQTGKLMNNAIWGRKRAVGGTTIAWGGQSLPFMSIDFTQRDWVHNSGWPISYNEIEPYYKEANSFMGIDTMNYNSDIFSKASIKNPGINPALFDFHVSKWAAQPNFYLLYKEELEKNVFVIYNAQVISIKKENSLITSLEVTNFQNSIFKTAINKLILAGGTIETVRILLVNKIAEDSGLLGKCFMEHPCIEVGTIDTNKQYNLQQYFNTHIWNGKKYSVRLTLNDNYQKENKLLNCSASIMFQFPEDVFDPYGELKSFKKDFKVKRFLKISKSIGSILKSLWAFAIDKFYFKSKAVAKCALMVEQEPVNESYITLGNSKDKFGILEALINWDITSKTWQTVVFVTNLLKEEFEKLKLGTFMIYPHIQFDTSNYKDYLTDVCHHMGGTRMSSSPDLGVVNTNLQVWNTENLYVCSCSVFPTSSHSNPTLTMLALAARLAEHLNQL